MKVGVLSDTHIPSRARSLPPRVFDIFADVELIVHAGDIVVESVLDELQTIAPVEAVAGNMDDIHLERRLGRKKVLNLEKIKLGLAHGSSDRTPQGALKLFKNVPVNCIIYGHSHQPYNDYLDGVLMFNPGSITDPRWRKHPSCGILIIHGRQIESEIVYL